MILIHKRASGVAMLSAAPGREASEIKKLEASNTPYVVADRVPEAEQDALYFDDSGQLRERTPSADEMFAAEMEALNVAYEGDTGAAIKKVSAAVAWDGVTETAKVANARAELAQLKRNYDEQSLSIINKYYGG